MESAIVRFAGFGGQGIVKAGEIFGMAAVADGKRALQNQAYGSSARGGLCTADVCVSPGEIFEIEPDSFDVLIALSQDSCDAFLHLLRPDGTLIYEKDLVKPVEVSHSRAYPVPATKIAAEELGRRIFTNMVVLGFCGAITGLISYDSLKTTIAGNVPPGTESKNLQAFEQGWNQVR